MVAALVDIVTFAGYFAVVVLGFWVRRKPMATSEEYFPAGRRLAG
ncbi:MAG: hypothetical protein ACUVX8_14010 [Candidatus Zipacnadales bacterium]